MLLIETWHGEPQSAVTVMTKGRSTWWLMVDEVAVNPRIKWVGGDGSYHGDNQVNTYPQGIGKYRLQFRCGGRVSLR